MRTGIVIAAVLTAMVVACGLIVMHAVEARADVCIAAAHELAALAGIGDWQRASEACRAYEAQWKTSLTWLELVLPEDATDSITEVLASLGTYLQAGDEVMSLRAARQLALAAEKMLEGEKLTLQSLL